MRKLIIALIIAIPLLSLSQKTSFVATLESSCTICNTGVIDFTGTGYKKNRQISVLIYKDGHYVGGRWDYTTSDSSGDIMFSYPFEWGVGNYHIEVYQGTVRSRYDLMATVDLTIL